MADQTITTRFKTEGAGRVAKETETIGRAQTRLGQASASAGRSFSAQANGLGGLVGAYAAAAANVFAITAAFEALGRAAQAEQIVRGTKLLALEIGESGQSILESVQKITQSQLTLAESSQNINIALSAGFNSDQIEQLSEVSLKASRALGRNLTDAFQRVVRGASKLEPELLDELGIFTRIDPAVEAYASKLNIAATSLTNYEKRQAFVNAVIEEGQKKFSAIDTSTTSSQKTFEQLRVTLVELATEFGILVANVLAPVAEFFKNNIGNALLLFGGILGLVFGRAVASIGAFAGQSIARLTAFTETLANSAAQMKSFSQSAAALEGSVGAAKAGAGLKVFQPKIGASARGSQTPEQANQLRETLKMQESGQLKTASAINRANKLYESQLKLLDPTAKRYDVLNNLLKQNREALAGAGFRAQALIAITNALNVSIKGLTTAFSILGGVVSGIFTGVAVAQLVGSLFDVDILKEIKDFFIDTSRAAEDLRVGVLGAVDAAAGGNLIQQLKNVGATDEDIDDLSKTLEKLNESIEDAATKSGPFSQALLAAKNRGIEPLTTAAADLSNAQRRLIVLQVELAREVEKGTDADRQRLLLLRNLIKAEEDFGGIQKLIGGISDNLALSSKKVADILKEQRDQIGDDVFLKFARNINVTDKAFSDLTEQQQKVITTFVLLENTLDKADKAFKGGTASSETLSKQLGGARKALQDFIEANTVFDETGAIFMGDPEELARQKKQIENIDGQVRSLKALEAQGKALNDSFGKFNKVLDEALQTGKVGFDGIAKSAQEVQANQANFLARQAGLSTLQQDQIKNEEVLAALNTDAEKRDSAQVKLVENRGKAIKAVFGLALQIPAEIEKERLGRQKVQDTLAQQILLQEKQNELQKLNNELNLQRAEQATQISLAEAQVKNLELQRDIRKEVSDNIKENIKQEQALFDIETSRLQSQNKLANIRADRAAAGRQAGREAGIAAQESKIRDFEAFPNLRNTEQLQAEQRKLIDLELENQLQIIADKKANIEREEEFQLQLLERQRTRMEEEVKANIAQMNMNNSITDREENIAKQNALIEQQKSFDAQDNIKKQIAIANKQNEIANLQIDAEAKKFAMDNEAFKRNIEGLKVQQAVVNKFVEALNSDNKFTQAIMALLEEEGRADLAAQIQTAGGPQQIASDFKILEGLQSGVEGLQDALIGQKRAGADQTTAGQVAVLEEELSREQKLAGLAKERRRLEALLAEVQARNANKELSRENEKINKKLEQLRDEEAIIQETAQARIEGLENEATLARANAEEQNRNLLRQKETLGDLGNAVIGDLNNGLSNALNTAFDNIAQGQSITQGLGDVLRGTFENVRKTVLEKTLIKPLQEKLESGLGGLFSMGGEEKGAENAKVRDGALVVTSDDGTTPKEITAEVSEKANSVFDTISSKLGEFKDKGISIFGELGGKLKDVFTGEGGLLSSLTGEGGLFSKIGGMFSSIFKGGGAGGGGGILSMFGGGGSGGGGGLLSGIMGMFGGGASGGFVPFSAYQRLAAGGQARDRVPSLLEPGEFVMKRSAANSIGGPALNQMNATGSMPGGNVVVNIENKGTPQDASASEPKFDGEKFVIDIVTRDLRNNGPIRKSLRGGGAG